MSLRDKASGRLFLVDSGADVSVFPVSLVDRPPSASSGRLVTANGTSIRTFGTKEFPLVFHSLKVSHKFIIAEVPRPILGSDFFSKVGLLIDLKNRQLVSFSRPHHHSFFSVLPACRTRVSATNNL